jgi:carbon storage regulator
VLVLTRFRDESIVIDDHIVITIIQVRGDKVRLGIDAPDAVRIHRLEVYERIQRERRESEQAQASGEEGGAS